MVLRIEDLDRVRSRTEFIDQVQRDYETVGLTWDEGPFFQAHRDEAYEDAFQLLSQRCGTYPCYCSRADLKAASAPHLGEKAVYPGNCRNLSEAQRTEKAQVKTPSQRVLVPARSIAFTDMIQGLFTQDLATECGDFLLKRADGNFAYQLAVVVDDGAQNITSVVRGYDLITSTPQQIFLQQELGLPEPLYAHIPLMVNGEGRRLSKRDKDASLDDLIQRFGTAEAVIGHIAYVGKVIDREEALTTSDLLQSFDLSTYCMRVETEVGKLQPITWF